MCGKLSLPTPYSELFHRHLSAPYSFVTRPAVRLCVRVCGGEGGTARTALNTNISVPNLRALN